MIARFLNRIICFLKSRRNNNARYLWFVIRKERYRYLSAILFPKYREPSRIINNERKVVYCPYEGNLEGGGLADRLRGILSTYYVCKQLGVEFRLVFNHPFRLLDYLEPNSYNWAADSNNLRYDIRRENILILDATQDSLYQKKQQKKWLLKHISKLNGQIHVYTNASFCYENGYHVLFHELFTPTVKLQNAIDKQLSLIGSHYVSISCRFLNIFGDFNETHAYTKQLSEEEKEPFLLSVINQVEKLHKKHPDCKILCNSDSITFLKRVATLNYTYVIPGEITHIDAKDSQGDYEKFEKTFLDFFMIAHAEHIYTLKTRGMHNSGYPYAASFIYEKPIDFIQF